LNLNGFHIDVSPFDPDRFGLGDFFVILIVAEGAKDGDRCTLGEHLHKRGIDFLDELTAIVPGGLLFLLAISIGVVAAGGNGEVDHCISIFEVNDVGIASEISAGEYFCFHVFTFFKLKIKLMSMEPGSEIK